MLTLFIAVVYSFSDGSIYYVLNRRSPWFSDFSVRDTRKIPMKKSGTQLEEDFSHQQIRLTIWEETSEVLHLEYSFVGCRNLDTSEYR